MRGLYLAFIFILIFSFAQSQKNVSITGCVKGLPSTKVYLEGFTGSKVSYLDSAVVTYNCFYFSVPDSIHGIYSVVLDRELNTFMQLIVNGEKIDFRTVYSSLLDSININASKENKIYYKYAKEIAHNVQQKELWTKLAASYSAIDPMQQKIKTELKRLELSANRITESLAGKNATTLAAAYIKLQKNVEVPVTYTGNKSAYQRTHFLDNINFANPGLLHTQLFLPKIISYIQLFDLGSYTFNEQVDTLASAFDRLLLKASANPEVYDFILTYMENRFRYGNHDIICAYLTQYYNGKRSLIKSYVQSDVRKRFNSLNHPTIGRKAPDIVMPYYNDSTLKLSGINSEYTLLVFWSTTCYHCIQSLPLLKKIYDAKQAGLEVLAISFDTDQNEWQNFVRSNNLGWINYSDLKGWQSEIAKSYDIQGTPTYILLDKNKNIISKPIALEDLVQELRALKLI